MTDKETHLFFSDLLKICCLIHYLFSFYLTLCQAQAGGLKKKRKSVLKDLQVSWGK